MEQLVLNNLLQAVARSFYRPLQSVAKKQAGEMVEQCNRLISGRLPFFVAQKNSDHSPSTIVLHTTEWEWSEFREDGLKSSGSFYWFQAVPYSYSLFFSIPWLIIIYFLSLFFLIFIIFHNIFWEDIYV